MIEQPLDVLTDERRGSLGDTVYSRNAYGQYTRPRTAPTQSTTSQAIQPRTALATLVARWKSLTPAQRTGWAVFAAAVPWRTTLHRSISLQPDLHYIRCNVPRDILNSGFIDDAPTVFSMPTFLLPTTSAFLTGGGNPRIRITVQDEPWTHVDGHQLYFATRPPLPPTHNYCPPGYTISGQFDSEAPSPPTYTRTYPTQYAFALGDKIPVTFHLSLADGRLSRPLKTLVTVT